MGSAEFVSESVEERVTTGEAGRSSPRFGPGIADALLGILVRVPRRWASWLGGLSGRSRHCSRHACVECRARSFGRQATSPADTIVEAPCVNVFPAIS